MPQNIRTAQTIKTLVQRALKVPSLKKAGNLRKLITHLEKHMNEEVTAEDIWEYVLDEMDSDTDGQRVRELAFRLRAVLKDIADDSGEDEFLYLPYADEMEKDGRKGYRLGLGHRAKRATEVFWDDHLHLGNIRLIYAEPVFYYDIVSLAYIRYLDTDPDSTKHDLAIKELKSKHGDELKITLGEGMGERLRPTRVYVGTGEMQALDRLTTWFERRAFIKPLKHASDQVPGLHGSCPILLGSERTNQIIKDYLDSDGGRKFCFRSSSEIGHVTIREARDSEKKAIAPYNVSERNGFTVFGQGATIEQVRDRPAIVTRMRMPGSKGAVTMISSDSTLAIREVAFALTDEQSTETIAAASGWRPDDTPKEFELLFSVRIAPAHFEREGSAPVLLGARAY